MGLLAYSWMESSTNRLLYLLLDTNKVLTPMVHQPKVMMTPVPTPARLPRLPDDEADPPKQTLIQRRRDRLLEKRAR